MNTEAKVGAFSLLGLGLATATTIGLSDLKLSFDKNYELAVGFQEIVGVNPSAEVRFAGVVVGSVESVETDGMGAVVKIKVRPDIKIPRGSKISPGTTGFLSEKFIGITPTVDRGDYYQNGEYVFGTPEVSMDNAIADMGKVADRAAELLESVNKVMGDPRLQGAMVDTAANIRDLTENLTKLSANFAQLSRDASPDLSEAVHNINRMTRKLNATAQRIDNIAASMENVATDPKTAEDLTKTIHNARELSDTAKKVLDKFKGTKLKFGVEEAYKGKEHDWTTNFDVQVKRPTGQFAVLGVTDIGETNKITAQIGRQRKNLAGRIGVAESRVGIGLDADVGKRVRLSLDAYDPNKVTLKARAQYKLDDDLYVFGQVNDFAKQDDRVTMFGIRKEF